MKIIPEAQRNGVCYGKQTTVIQSILLLDIYEVYFKAWCLCVEYSRKLSFQRWRAGGIGRYAIINIDCIFGAPNIACTYPVAPADINYLNEVVSLRLPR